MKTTLLALTLAAATASVSAPGFAMDNPVSQSRALIERTLAAQEAASTDRTAPTVRATTFNTKKPVILDRSETAFDRLFGFRHGPSGR